MEEMLRFLIIGFALVIILVWLESNNNTDSTQKQKCDKCGQEISSDKTD